MHREKRGILSEANAIVHVAEIATRPNRIAGSEELEDRLPSRLQRPSPADCRPAALGLWQQIQVREQVVD